MPVPVKFDKKYFLCLTISVLIQNGMKRGLSFPALETISQHLFNIECRTSITDL